MRRVDIGVFAHNEAAGIGAMIARLAAQDILRTEGVSARILVLTNGCQDSTLSLAQAAAAGTMIEVVDLPLGGKSRTWNRFVHDLSRPAADVLIFVDADIEFRDDGALAEMLRNLGGLWVLNSQPVKDTVVRPEGLSRMDRFVAAAAGGLDNWKTAVCGSLYAMPATIARRFHLPIGLPVEDGFLRAMVLRDAITGPEDFSRIDGLEGMFHVYGSERSLSALIRHQVRIVIGSAVNYACFGELDRLPLDQRHAELARAAGDEAWVARAIKTRLPEWPGGYIPLHFTTKRLVRAAQNPADLLRPKRVLITVLGFGFDLIVYLRAQWAMWRGTGAGFW
jgi:glycosyltransferase involved in cell wall biosynthesis